MLFALHTAPLKPTAHCGSDPGCTLVFTEAKMAVEHQESRPSLHLCDSNVTVRDTDMLVLDMPHASACFLVGTSDACFSWLNCCDNCLSTVQFFYLQV